MEFCVGSPKLFVSYSWTSPDHEAWVLKLSTELRQAGVDVILDKWDLKEGHDAHAFMEKMVTDPEIEKVILICDKGYVDKTDGRTGGVGTEAQIISGEIYKKQAQDKFVAVIAERDHEGNAYVPAYYRSRIHIDLSDSGTFEEGFEQLLRWVFNKPLHIKPNLGDKPAFLSDEEGVVTLATSYRFRRALDAIRNKREQAVPATVEYFGIFSKELEKLRIENKSDPFDEAVVDSIRSFLPYRNEAIEIFNSLALYHDTQDMRTALHRFFEQLTTFLFRPPHINHWKSWDFDNYKFIVHELFLYAVSCLIRSERFEAAAYLMSNDYYLPGQSDYGQDQMVSFVVFAQKVESLEGRNRRLKLRRSSIHADLLEQRCNGVEINFQQIMQTDFILFMRNQLTRDDAFSHWWPETLLYSHNQAGPFEVFARSNSSSYFDRAKVLLGIEGKDQLERLLERFSSGKRHLPGWNYWSINPSRLLGFDQIATKP